MRVRIPPPAADIDRLFAGWCDDLHVARKYVPTVRKYTAGRLASLIGPRVSELCLLEVHDIRWDLGTFGKVLLRGLPVTAQQLHEDRILEEAAVTGADPQAPCTVFDITPETGLRYTRCFNPDPTDSDDASGCNMETSWPGL